MAAALTRTLNVTQTQTAEAPDTQVLNFAQMETYTRDIQHTPAITLELPAHTAHLQMRINCMKTVLRVKPVLMVRAKIWTLSVIQTQTAEALDTQVQTSARTEMFTENTKSIPVTILDLQTHIALRIRQTRS
jgi:hypothetical protein